MTDGEPWRITSALRWQSPTRWVPWPVGVELFIKATTFGSEVSPRPAMIRHGHAIPRTCQSLRCTPGDSRLPISGIRQLGLASAVIMVQGDPLA